MKQLRAGRARLSPSLNLRTARTDGFGSRLYNLFRAWIEKRPTLSCADSALRRFQARQAPIRHVRRMTCSNRPLDHFALVSNMGLAFGDVPISLS
jgi:hypothetical protein